MTEQASTAKASITLHDLKDRKGALSRKIGAAKKAGEPIDALLAEMKALTSQIKMLEAEQEGSKKAASVNRKPDSERTKSPQRFTAAGAHSANLTLERTISATEHDAARWDAYVTQHPQASAYHPYCIRQVIEQSFGHNTHYLIAESADGTVVGVLPLVQLNSKLFGNYVVSLPFFNYGGVLADTTDIEEKLFEAAAQWAKHIGAKHTELRHIHERNIQPVKQDKITMLLALPNQVETLWSDIGTKVRAQIKKTDEHKPTHRIGHKELLNDFYHVFAINMRDLGTPVYSKQWFANLLDALPNSSWIVVAYIDGKPAAASFLIGWRDTLEIPWASSLRKYNHTNVNMYMYWQVLSHAIGQGYAFFDFGRSSKDANTYRFKKQWGATPHPLYWHYQLAEGDSLPELNPNNPKYRLMIAAWQRLPVFVSKLIGPQIVKNLP